MNLPCWTNLLQLATLHYLQCVDLKESCLFVIQWALHLAWTFFSFFASSPLSLHINVHSRPMPIRFAAPKFIVQSCKTSLPSYIAMLLTILSYSQSYDLVGPLCSSPLLSAHKNVSLLFIFIHHPSFSNLCIKMPIYLLHRFYPPLLALFWCSRQSLVSLTSCKLTHSMNALPVQELGTDCSNYGFKAIATLLKKKISFCASWCLSVYSQRVFSIFDSIFRPKSCCRASVL